MINKCVRSQIILSLFSIFCIFFLKTKAFASTSEEVCETHYDEEYSDYYRGNNAVDICFLANGKRSILMKIKFKFLESAHTRATIIEIYTEEIDNEIIKEHSELADLIRERRQRDSGMSNYMESSSWRRRESMYKLSIESEYARIFLEKIMMNPIDISPREKYYYIEEWEITSNKICMKEKISLHKSDSNALNLDSSCVEKNKFLELLAKRDINKANYYGDNSRKHNFFRRVDHAIYIAMSYLENLDNYQDSLVVLAGGGGTQTSADSVLVAGVHPAVLAACIGVVGAMIIQSCQSIDSYRNRLIQERIHRENKEELKEEIKLQERIHRENMEKFEKQFNFEKEKFEREFDLKKQEIERQEAQKNRSYTSSGSVGGFEDSETSFRNYQSQRNQEWLDNYSRYRKPQGSITTRVYGSEWDSKGNLIDSWSWPSQTYGGGSGGCPVNRRCALK